MQRRFDIAHASEALGENICLTLTQVHQITKKPIVIVLKKNRTLSDSMFKCCNGTFYPK